MTNLRSLWNDLSLVRQFALLACTVAAAGTLMLGSFVSDEIQADVIYEAAVAGSLYVNSINKPYLEELTRGSEPRQELIDMLDASFTDSELGRQIMAVTIWRPDGSIVYATKHNPTRTDFWTNPNLQKALKGQVSGCLENPPDGTAAPVHGEPLLEVYTPIHGRNTGGVVGVAAFFTRADLLESTIETVRLRSWIAAGSVALLQITSFYAILRRANKMAVVRRDAIVGAHRALLEANERFLRRISADLHDGPVQLISLALLKLNGLRPLLAEEHSESEEIDKIQDALQDSLQEIRYMSAGLAPPHLENLSLERILKMAVAQHEQRTDTVVDADIGALPDDVSTLHKVSIYRFVQQGLHNAYLHADGAGQRIHAFSDGGTLTVEVADSGPGFLPSRTIGSGRLGLSGMRDRIESLGGIFTLETRIGFGTILRASFRLDDITAPRKTQVAVA